MNTSQQLESPPKRIIKALFLTVPMMLLIFVPMTGLNFSSDPLKFIPAFVPYV